MGGDGDAWQAPEHPGWQKGCRERSPGEILTGTAVCSEEAGFAEANPGFHTDLICPTGILSLAESCQRQGGHVSAQWAPPGLTPHCQTTRHLPPPTEAAFPGKPPSRFPLHPSSQAAAPLAACSVGVLGSLWCSTPPPPLEESCRASPQHPAPWRSHPIDCRDRALGFIAVHHSPAVHSPPSCFQPGQHAGPVGSLRERCRGHQPGQGGAGAGAALQLRLRQSECRHLPRLDPVGGEAAWPPGASLRKEASKIEGNLRGCSLSRWWGWAVG